MDYRNFDLQIERAGDGAYRAMVLASPVGQAEHVFTLPFQPLELDNYLLRLDRPRQSVRGEPETLAAAQSFGARLYDAVFGGAVSTALASSLERTSAEGASLRIRLRLTRCPELLNLPWEFLRQADLDRFFSLSTHTPLVRYLDLPESVRPLAIQLPIRVLAVISSPHGAPPLDVEREWANVRDAFRNLSERGLAIVERLATPTLAALQEELKRQPYHILHFVGHGVFNQVSGLGSLLFEDAQRDRFVVNGRQLGVVLHDHRSLRLVLLNACEGGQTSDSDPFAGTAQRLVQQGMLAVITMQFHISDEAAVQIARGFYERIAAGDPVDVALTAARQQQYAQAGNAEWARQCCICARRMAGSSISRRSLRRGRSAKCPRQASTQRRLRHPYRAILHACASRLRHRRGRCRPTRPSILSVSATRSRCARLGGRG